MMVYDYDAKTNTIHTRPVGTLTTEDSISYFLSLIDDDTIAPEATEKVYLAGLDDIQITFTGAIQMRDEYERVLKKHHFKQTIFVVDDDLGFGMARLIQNVFAHINFRSSIEKVAATKDI